MQILEYKNYTIDGLTEEQKNKLDEILDELSINGYFGKDGDGYTIDLDEFESKEIYDHLDNIEDRTESQDEFYDLFSEYF